MNLKELNEYFEPYYDKWDRLIIPYEYLEVGKYYTPTDSYRAYKFVGEKDDELIFENKKGEEIKYSKDSKFSPYETKKKSDFMPLPKYMTMKDGAAKNVERLNYIKTTGKPSKYENKSSCLNIKELHEQIYKMLNEELGNDFRLTDLHYVINYNSGKSFKRDISKVDPSGYELYDLGPAQIADIVLKNLKDSGAKFTSNDSSQIDYDPQTGIIKNVTPIMVSNNEGNDIATISFEMKLWTHPDRIGYR